MRNLHNKRIIAQEIQINNRNGKYALQLWITSGYHVDRMKSNFHMVDTATQYCTSRFVRIPTSEEIWKLILRMWNLVIATRQTFCPLVKGAIISNEFRKVTTAEVITLREAPIGTPGYIFLVELYNSNLRRAYMTLRSNMTNIKSK